MATVLDHVLCVLFVQREWRRKVLRSSSNPDLLSETQASSNGRIHSNRGGSPSSTSSSGETPPPPSSAGMVVTFSEDTTEAAAEAMEEFLGKTSSHASHFRPLAAVLGGIRGKKKAKKKSRKASAADDCTTESPLVTQSQRERGESPLRDSAHSSPRSKQKKKRSLLFKHSKSHDGSSEVIGEGSDVTDSQEELRGSCENVSETTDDKGRRRRRKMAELHVQPRLQISSPLTRDWSGSELRNEELQSLVRPPPAAWSMTGYLWLRLHTDNNRYEWTHIVSGGLCYHIVFVLPCDLIGVDLYSCV